MLRGGQFALLFKSCEPLAFVVDRRDAASMFGRVFRAALRGPRGQFLPDDAVKMRERMRFREIGPYRCGVADAYALEHVAAPVDARAIAVDPTAHRRSAR